MAEHPKRIAIRQGDQTHTVTIDVGTSAADILASIEAGPDAWLTKDNGTPYGPDENLYMQIEDGAKLDVISNAVVATEPPRYLGCSPLAKREPPVQFSALLPWRGKVSHSSAFDGNLRLKIPAQPDRAAISELEIVKRGTRTVEAQRGWTLHSAGRLNGYYKSPGAPPFKGRIECENMMFYVFDPAGTLADGHHSMCFHEAPKFGPKWYWVHISPTPDAVSTGIKAVEDYMREIFGS